MPKSRGPSGPDWQDRAWQPPPGFSESKPGVWTPDNYIPDPFELEAPVVETAEHAIREYVRCEKSLAYFALRHCWTIHVDDPGTGPLWRKFPNYPYIRNLFHELQNPDNFHIDKSRQMLATWALMIAFLWDILFRNDWANMVMSWKQDEVDDGGMNSTYNSLLGKARNVWTALPPYLQSPLEIRYLMLLNPANRSSIRGDSAASATGHGRAVKRGLMDECARIPHSRTIYKGMRSAAKRGLVLLSTPDGKDNLFGDIKFMPHTTFRKLSVHWSLHPDRAKGMYCTCGWTCTEEPGDPEPHEQFANHECQNPHHTPPTAPEMRSPWYDNEVRNMTPEQVASQLDISYERSRRGRVFSAFDTRRQVFNHQALSDLGEMKIGERIGDYQQRYLRAAIKPGLQCVVGWDFGIADATSLVLGQIEDDARMYIRWLDTFEDTNKSWDYYHAFVQASWAPVVRAASGLDITHYGDPSGKGRQSDLLSWVINLRRADPPIVVIHQPQRGQLLEWVDFVHNVVRKGTFEVSSWAEDMLNGLANWHYPTDDQGEPVPGKQNPVHDRYSHMMTAMIYVYKFRWSAMLTNANKKVVTARQILSIDTSKPPETGPKQENANTGRKLKYFDYS